MGFDDALVNVSGTVDYDCVAKPKNTRSKLISVHVTAAPGITR